MDKVEVYKTRSFFGSVGTHAMAYKDGFGGTDFLQPIVLILEMKRK